MLLKQSVIVVLNGMEYRRMLLPRLREAGVVGSNPVSPTNKINKLSRQSASADFLFSQYGAQMVQRSSVQTGLGNQIRSAAVGWRTVNEL
jgi:hypothetical protein